MALHTLGVVDLEWREFEVDASHVVMISQSQAVTGPFRTALGSIG